MKSEGDGDVRKVPEVQASTKVSQMRIMNRKE